MRSEQKDRVKSVKIRETVVNDSDMLEDTEKVKKDRQAGKVRYRGWIWGE